MRTLRGPLTYCAIPIEVVFKEDKNRSAFIDYLVEEGRSIDVGKITLKDFGIKLEFNVNINETLILFVFLENKVVIKKDIDFNAPSLLHNINFSGPESNVEANRNQIVTSIGFVTYRKSLAFKHTLYDLKLAEEIHSSNC